MPAAYDDPENQELQEQMMLEQAAKPRGGWATMPFGAKAAVLVMGGIIFFVTWTGRWAPRKGIAALVAVGIIFFFLARDHGRRTPLTPRELRIRLNDELMDALLHPIGPIPQILAGTKWKIDLVGRRYFFGGEPTKHAFKVVFYYPDFRHTENLSEQDVYSGIVVGFKEYPEGVSGRETQDLKPVPSPEMSAFKWQRNYLGLGGKGK